LFELLVVDDNSQDGTLEIVQELQKTFPWLKILVRRQKRDLSQAVFDGFKHAHYARLVTLDADLSHPPENIPTLLKTLDEPGVDMVIGSRYVAGGSIDGVWPLSRKIASKLAAWSSRYLLPCPVQDPLSGFLALKKSLLATAPPFNLIGWKWGLEVMVKCQCKQIREVPIHFSQRQQGDSKLTVRTIYHYFQHLCRLMLYKTFSSHKQ
jgi:dolichol-phosphate mannosyltransferase